MEHSQASSYDPVPTQEEMKLLVGKILELFRENDSSLSSGVSALGNALLFCARHAILEEPDGEVNRIIMLEGIERIRVEIEKIGNPVAPVAH